MPLLYRVHSRREAHPGAKGFQIIKANAVFDIWRCSREGAIDAFRNDLFVWGLSHSATLASVQASAVFCYC